MNPPSPLSADLRGTMDHTRNPASRDVARGSPLFLARLLSERARAPATLLSQRCVSRYRDLLRASSLTKKKLEPALDTLLCEDTVRRRTLKADTWPTLRTRSLVSAEVA